MVSVRYQKLLGEPTMLVTVKGNTVEFQADGDSHKEIFRKLAQMHEVFNDEACGVCKNKNTVFRVRRVDDPKKKGKTYEYFERVCGDRKCNARLAYGQHNEGGTLFPKRRDDNKEWLPNNGWEKYKGKQEE
jgi:uncharacterized short protein YbdD (DUF466 family)